MAGKGRETEKLAKRAYEDAGYTHVYHPPKAKYRNQDVFDLFDLLAYHPDDGLHFAQVKTNRSAGITSWFPNTEFIQQLPATTVEFVVLHEGSGWRLARPADDGYQWVYDGRSDGEDELHEGLTAALRPNGGAA